MMVFVPRWSGTGKGYTLDGLADLAADLIKDRQSGGLQIVGGSPVRTGSAPKPKSGGGASPHRGGTSLPPLTLQPETYGIMPDSSPPNVTDSQPFRKGSYLAPDTVRVDAGTGEGAYNPSSSMDRLQQHVQQAYDFMRKRSLTNTPSVAPAVAPDVQTIPAAATSTGGGGGGGGGAPSGDDTAAPTSWWGGLSTPMKAAIIGGGVVVLGGGLYFIFRKRGGGSGPSSKS